jgi:hypothetical protein
MSLDASHFSFSYLNLLFYPLIFDKDLSIRFDANFYDWIENLKTKHSMNERQITLLLQEILTSTGWKNSLPTTQDMAQSENELKALIRDASIKLKLL